MSTGSVVMEKAVKSISDKPKASIKEMADVIRVLSMDAVQKANSGHPGMPMGMADVAAVLFSEFLKYDPKHPQWPDRDRFILSAGHGSMLLYSLLYLTGYEDITLDEIKNFRQMGAKTAGHPEYGEAAGIETTTGPLGQGVGNAVGMAIAEASLDSRFGDDLVDHYTYVIAGDGCLMEGISQEAISLAGHLELGKMILLFDDNGITIDGSTDISITEDQIARFEASGWHTQSIDGHDADAIRVAISNAKNADKPSLIACKTTIAKGAPTKAGTSSSHGAPLGDEEIAGVRANLGWDAAPFEIPENILAAWRDAGARSEGDYAAWQKNLDNSAKKSAFEDIQSGKISPDVGNAISELKKSLAENKPKDATRKSSGNTLDAIAKYIPGLLGGSADLTGSNNTLAKEMQAFSKENYAGRYMYYGVREHAMCAAMNGMVLHGGIIPYSGTFFVFTDYCRPSIRLAALMGLRVIYVMTHDSIGLGEDGPTHQPVEHLASLRAMPNINIFRPADGVETAEAWQLALESENTPSVLVLTRQGLPTQRVDYTDENITARGGYIISQAEGEAQVTIIATGSEVEIAIAAQEKLKADGIAANVVSMPCTSLFDQQPEAYKEAVLGSGLRVAVEAAIGFGWERYIGRDGIFVGMDGFGASAPASELYEHFGITADNVVAQIKERIGK